MARVLALGNHDDADCAAQLRGPPHTVRVRRRSIFRQTLEQRPDWLGALRGSDRRRGVWKRRHLLAKLARHM